MSDADDYGLAGVPDIAVGVHALRTFTVAEGKLASIIQGVGHWESGVCAARCLKADHEAPATDCSCGIYGCLTVAALVRQYPQFARDIVTVIAAEGATTIGSVGLRTARARVVAYWCAEKPDHRTPIEADVCAEQCPGARRYYDRDLMARLYGLGER